MSKKLIIGLAVVGVLIVGMMGAGFLVIWNKMTHMQPGVASAAPTATAEKAEAATPPVGVSYPLDTFIVNLADKGGNRYLRVTLALELADEALQKKMDQRLPQVRDALLTILPSKSIEEIITAEGKDLLREEILERLNSFLGEGKVSNLYFTEFVIQ